MRTLVQRTSLVALSLAALAFAPTAMAQRPTTTPPPPATGSGGGATSEISLSVGEQYSLPATNIRSYSEGVSGIVDVRVPQDGSRLLLVGQRPGTTSLLVLRTDGSQQTFSITVFRLPVELVRQQLTQLLQNYSGVTLNQIGGRIFIEGGVASDAQLARVRQIALIYTGQVESLVSVDPTIVERRINIRTDLYFVELSRQGNYVFGIGWPGSYGGDSVAGTMNVAIPLSPAGSVTAALQAVVTLPVPRLDLASNVGWARVHRQASVVSVNGQAATYFSGGDFNVLTQSSAIAAPTVNVIQFGTTLRVTPRFDPSNSRVELALNAENTSLVDTGAPIPSRNISRVETHVNLQLGQSIVLSGMRSRSLTVGSNGLPLLAQIPVVGALFGSQSRRDQEGEMVLFVVPTVIEGISRQSEDRVAAALRAYEDFGGSMPDNLMPRPASPTAGGAAAGAATPSPR